jgi:hypothetical protein
MWYELFMTGKQFKAFFLKRHGTKWAKGAAAELNCSRFTCQRYAIMAEITHRRRGLDYSWL